MKPEQSSQSAELDSYHRDIDPGFGAAFGGFIIPNQTALVHQPAEGTLHHPAAGQHFETRQLVRTLDDFNVELGTPALDPVGKGRSALAAIDPEQAQPVKPDQHTGQQGLRPVPFGDAGRRHVHAQEQAQCVDQQVALASFDPLGRIVTDRTTVGSGLHTLTVEDGRRGAAAFARGVAHAGPETGVESLPGVIPRPLPKDMVDGFPRGKTLGQQAPLNAPFDDIKNRVEDAAPVGGRSSAFLAHGEHGVEEGPLGIGQTGVVQSVFHRSDWAAPLIDGLSLRHALSNSIADFYAKSLTATQHCFPKSHH